MKHAKATPPNQPTKHVEASREDFFKRQREEANFQTEQDRNKYKLARQLEYPSLEDQLDFIVKNGVTKYRKMMKEIKDRHPKPV